MTNITIALPDDRVLKLKEIASCLKNYEEALWKG